MRHRALGRHHRSPRIPYRSYFIALLAAIALAVSITGLAGAGSSSAAVGQGKAPATRVHAVAVADTSSLGDKSAIGRAATMARLTAATAARAHAAAVLAAHTYLVRSGDSISGVAVQKCGAARFWTGTYAASRARGWTAANANVLATGQHLWLSCSYLPSMLRFAPAPPPPPAPARVVTAVTYHGTYHRAYYHRSYTAAVSGTYHGSGSMEQCIISRESGGNSQVMNSSGHYGLYQFSESTWVGSGGSAADFGHASVAEQQRVFQNAVAARGYSDWAPYDGC